METNELQIITECQNGDLSCFGDIYNKYIDKIYCFIYYRTGHKQTAEDITSAVFLKSMDKISGFNPRKGKFSSWLYRIARNSVIDHYRTKKEEYNVDECWYLGDNDEIESRLDAGLKLGQVKKYLSNFSEDQREIIIMRVWDGLSYAEIADITGKSEGALKMAVSRILRKIRNNPELVGIYILIGLNYS